MSRALDRPIGVALIAAFLAIKGVASLAMATDLITFDLARASHADEPAAGVAVITGLLLLYKAHGLWTLRRGAWLMTVLLVLIDGVAAVSELLVGTRSLTVWVSLALAVGIGLYLLQPSVRGLYTGKRSGS